LENIIIVATVIPIYSIFLHGQDFPDKYLEEQILKSVSYLIAVQKTEKQQGLLNSLKSSDIE